MSRSAPPKWAIRFLRWYCRKDYLNEIEGDLFELYTLRAKGSRRKANLFFVWNVLRSFRLINMKRNAKPSGSGLLANYFKIGYRALIKDLRFSIINATGLSLGLAVFLAITLLVRHELSFDKFHENADRIYQVIQVFQNADGDDPEIFTSTRLSEALRTDMDMVENAVTIHGATSTWANINGKRFFEEEGIVAGPQFLEIFDFKLLKGDADKALREKRSIVITSALASKYFGFEDPMGKEIELQHYGRFTITAVLEDIPSNSYIQFEYLITQDYDVFMETVSPRFKEYFYSWHGDPAATYVLLNDPASKGAFEEQISLLLEKYLGSDQETNRHYLLGMLDLHFNSHGIDGRINNYVKGDYKKVKFLILIAIIILAMACLNYINISTARYIRRAREVGVRKAMGAYRSQITFQFLAESFLVVLISFIAGICLIYYLLPYFNMITGIKLSPDVNDLFQVFPYFTLTIIVVTLLAGFWPAFYLSRLSSIKALKNMTLSVKGNGILRKGLVTVQYFFVVTILAALVIVNQQYSYMSNQSPGFSTDQLVIVEINSGEVRNNYKEIKEQLLQLPDVQNVTGLTRMISGYRSGTAVEVNPSDQPEESTAMRYYGIDKDGLSALELSLVAGNDFSGIDASDSTSILINETAAALYGGNDAIGKLVKIQETGGDALNARIIGIVRDFHYRSLRKAIGPVVIGHYNNPFVSLDDIVIQLSGFNTMSTLEKIEDIHNSYDTNQVMTWEFMDDMIQREYEKEKVFRNVFVGASAISFLIALLGMIGLTSYSITAKTKEIGIRKILGASFFSVLNIETREMSKYFMLSVVVAVPATWWMITSWLQNFEYRVAVSPLTFLAVVVFMLAVMYLVVLLVGRKVAKEPPVEVLRNE